MTCAVYIIGGPGTGKSTLMSHLLEDWEAGPYQRFTEREMFGHDLVHPILGKGVYLGHLRPEYPGTDALSLSVAPHALTWLAGMPQDVAWVFGEGNRLSHPAFLEALHARTRLTVVHLVLDPEVAAERRKLRGGKELSDKFCKTATGTARNAARRCEDAGMRVLHLDATVAPERSVKAVLGVAGS